VERGTEPGATRYPAQPQDRVSLDPLRLGLIPHCALIRAAAGSQSTPGARRCGTCPRSATRPIASLHRPVNGFFEWRAIKGQKAKRPYAIAMGDGSPFGIAGVWENWEEPASGEWIRTFAIITTDANGLVADIHDRMLMILAPPDHDRWLGEEPDPRDLMRPYPAEPMRMWPISTRVNKPENDDPSVVKPIELSTAIA
jgi:putative SOS response-associated peptidase YedK